MHKVRTMLRFEIDGEAIKNLEIIELEKEMIDALIAFFEISLVGTKMCVIKKASHYERLLSR